MLDFPSWTAAEPTSSSQSDGGVRRPGSHDSASLLRNWTFVVRGCCRLTFKKKPKYFTIFVAFYWDQNPNRVANVGGGKSLRHCRRHHSHFFVQHCSSQNSSVSLPRPSLCVCSTGARPSNGPAWLMSGCHCCRHRGCFPSVGGLLCTFRSPFGR